MQRYKTFKHCETQFDTDFICNFKTSSVQPQDYTFMKRLLVPTDFSVQAENALKVAVKIAQKNNSEIFLLHSMELPLHLATAKESTGIPEPLFYMKLARKHFEEFRQKPYLNEVVVHELVGQGEIYEEIEDACNRNNIDLIVMGSTGASGFKEMFVGSNTEKVVRTSATPVLVIKDKYSEFNVSDFVFATDLSDKFKDAFQKASSFASVIGAKIHLLYVNTPVGFKTTSEAEKLMQDFIKDMKLNNYTLNIYNDVSVEKGILNFAGSIQAQLIGMATHGRKGISHFLNGSISEDMANRANLPVITFRI